MNLIKWIINKMGSQNRKMTMVFSYDISRAKIRRKISSILEEESTRVQGSVFEAWMTPQEAKGLFHRLSLFLDDSDSLRLYAVTRNAKTYSLSYGIKPMMEEGGYWIV